MLTILFAVAAIGAPVSPPPAKQLDYFPVAVGTEWTYQCDGQPDATKAVTAAEAQADGSKLVTIGFLKDGKFIQAEKLIVTKDGVDSKELAEPGSYVCFPQMLRLPLADGKWWKCESNYLGIQCTGKRTAHGPERLKVPAGEFDAMRVEFVGEIADAAGKPTGPPSAHAFWYAPGVGMVKSCGREAGGKESGVYVLKSFKLPPVK